MPMKVFHHDSFPGLVAHMFAMAATDHVVLCDCTMCVCVSRGFNLQQGRSSRSPPDSNEKTPSSTPPSTGVDENAEPSLAAGQRQRSRSRTTPTDQPTLPGGGITSAAGSGGGSGGQLKSPGAAWRRQQSPGINLLSLLQSPNPPGKTDLFTSPGLKVVPFRFPKKRCACCK